MLRFDLFDSHCSLRTLEVTRTLVLVACGMRNANSHRNLIDYTIKINYFYCRKKSQQHLEQCGFAQNSIDFEENHLRTIASFLQSVWNQASNTWTSMMHVAARASKNRCCVWGIWVAISMKSIDAKVITGRNKSFSLGRPHFISSCVHFFFDGQWAHWNAKTRTR